jgi:hypothetical protein
MDCLLCRGNNIISQIEDTDEDYGTCPSIPIAYDDLKKDIRCGLSAEARQLWWPILPSIQPGAEILTAPNIKELSEKKYLWAKERVSHHPLSSGASSSLETGVDDRCDRIDEILALLIHMYDLKEPGLVKTYVSILVLMIPSVDICFHTCCATLDRPDWFISPTAVNHRLKLYTFKELVRKYLPKQYSRLERIGGLGSEFLNLLFIDLFFSLMPTPDVMRVMDAFLLEGTKVIHRFGLGIIFINRDLLEGEGIRFGQSPLSLPPSLPPSVPPSLLPPPCSHSRYQNRYHLLGSYSQQMSHSSQLQRSG